MAQEYLQSPAFLEGQETLVHSLVAILTNTYGCELAEKMRPEVEAASRELHISELRLRQSVQAHGEILLNLEKQIATLHLSSDEDKMRLRASLQGYLTAECVRAKGALTIDAVERIIANAQLSSLT